MSDVDLPLFGSSITRRDRGWRRCVSGEAGRIVLPSTERSRPAAQYMAARATSGYAFTRAGIRSD